MIIYGQFWAITEARHFRSFDMLAVVERTGTGLTNCLLTNLDFEVGSIEEPSRYKVRDGR